MDELNPYAAPEIPAVPPDRFDELFESRGCWRAGKSVVTTLEGRLPPRCVLTNEPALRHETISLTWYPEWAWLSILFGPFFFVPLIFWGRRIKLEVATGATHAQNKRRNLRYGLLSLVVGLLLLPISAALQVNASLATLGLVLALVTIVGGLGLLSSSFAHPLTIKRADKRFVWLSGAGMPFLESLPPWPGK